MRRSCSLLIGLILLSCAHRPGAPAVAQPKAERAVVASAPASAPTTTASLISRPGSVAPVQTRVSLHRAVVLGLQQRYLAEEGMNARGPLFRRVVGAIDQARREDAAITEFEVLALLGPPDFGGALKQGGEFVYIYRENGQEHTVTVYTGPEGLVKLVGYNLLSDWSFEGFPRPTPYPRLK